MAEAIFRRGSMEQTDQHRLGSEDGTAALAHPRFNSRCATMCGLMDQAVPELQVILPLRLSLAVGRTLISERLFCNWTAERYL